MLGQRDYAGWHDDDLVRAVQAGEAEAFEPLLDRHLQHVRTFIALKAPVAHLIDEVAHESFVYAFNHIGSFTAGTSFRSWLHAIAWNLLRAEVQRFSREQANKARFAENQFWNLPGHKDDQPSAVETEHLEDCVRSMPEPMRQLLTLKYTQDCSSEEIASRLQRSIAWVRTVLFRVRQQLKECIEEKLGKERPC